MTTGLDSVKLYSRAVTLTIGVVDNPDISIEATFNKENLDGFDPSGLDIEFTIERTLKPEPNTCNIVVYNLNEDSRKLLSGAKKLTIKLEAGYQGGTSLLYLGEVRAAWTSRNGPDFLTHLESGDGEKEVQKSRINASYGAKVPMYAAVSAIVKALGVGAGNSTTISSLLASKGIANIGGGALTGSAAQRLTDICRSAQLEWSIQHGNIQILDIGQTISKQAIQVSADTGMIESPTVDCDGVLSFSTLIIPGMNPGVLVNMNSLFVNGGYRVERCKWHGQIFGNDWQVDCEAKKY